MIGAAVGHPIGLPFGERPFSDLIVQSVFQQQLVESFPLRQANSLVANDIDQSQSQPNVTLSASSGEVALSVQGLLQAHAMDHVYLGGAPIGAMRVRVEFSPALKINIKIV